MTASGLAASRADQTALDPPVWCRRAADLSAWAGHDWGAGLQIDTVAPGMLYVRTLNSVYEIAVLSKHSGQVLLRGGRFFPDRTTVVLAGSSLGGAFLKLHGVYLGFRMELHHAGRRIMTSPVQQIRVVPIADPGEPGRSSFPCH